MFPYSFCLSCCWVVLAFAKRQRSPGAVMSPGSSEAGVILSIADVHFDPFYDPTLFQSLVRSPTSEWTRIFDGSQVSGYGEYGKDSNYNLFASALRYAAQVAPKAEFILLAGDWLAHGFSDTYYQYAGNRDPRGLHEFIDKTITFLTQRLREKFPHIPIYPALGNEDSYCGDYQLQPKGGFLRRTADTWKGLLHNGKDEQAFMQTFPTGGYYAASAPGTPEHRVVILNTVVQCSSRPTIRIGAATRKTTRAVTSYAGSLPN